MAKGFDSRLARQPLQAVSAAEATALTAQLQATEREIKDPRLERTRAPTYCPTS